MGENISKKQNELLQLYTQIANNTIRELPDNWTNVGIGLAVDNQGFETFLVYYSVNHGKTYRDFIEESFEYDPPAEGLFEAKESCQELRNLCIHCGDDWRQFALVIDTEEHFSADFSYEPIEKFTPLHLQLWRGRYLK